KGVACDFRVEKPWDPSAELLAINPSGEVPVLVVKENDQPHVLADAAAICEYLDETQAAGTLIGKAPLLRAEVRRLVGWFDRRFHWEVTVFLLGEKALKRLTGTGEPDSVLIRTGCHNIHGHLDYIGWLAEHRNWLAGDGLTLADLAAAAQLSVIDYLGDVPWSAHAAAKEWYARIKSRPSFRGLLGDHIAGFPPPRYYADLDF
ncbi:MAG: glutathione S-transferase family protein, partial [Bdellovibrionales bacterium]